MESGNTACEAVHAAVQRGSEQVWHDGAGCVNVYQGAARPDIVLSEILSRRHLWKLRDEHRRREHSGLHNVIPHSYTISDIKSNDRTIEFFKFGPWNFIFGSLAWMFEILNI